MDITKYNKNLFSFLTSSPTPFHVVDSIEKTLKGVGFKHLRENEFWNLQKGHGYYVSREQGSIIAFILGSGEQIRDGFRMLGAHTDSPCLQIKPQPDILSANVNQLAVELYGGSLLNTWFDRDLGLAGRVSCAAGDTNLYSLLVDFRKPLLTIPSAAIHLNREANQKNDINKQKHLVPILCGPSPGSSFTLNTILGEYLEEHYPNVTQRKILSFDLFCYDFQPPSYLGYYEDFIGSSRLDNQISCHAGLEALLSADRSRNCLLFCANHEENGSTSSVGAQGSILDSILERIMPESEERRISLHNSFLISMDNSHATHPNYSDKSDANHLVELGKGPVIKINANQRYSTSSLSSAIFKQICDRAEIHPQEFVMRNDIPCGSTIGPMTAARLGVRSIDIGVPSLAMHSIRELTGASDPFKLYSSASTFFQNDIHKKTTIYA